MVMVMAKRGCNMIPHYIMNNMGFIENSLTNNKSKMQFPDKRWLETKY